MKKILALLSLFFILLILIVFTEYNYILKQQIERENETKKEPEVIIETVTEVIKETVPTYIEREEMDYTYYRMVELDIRNILQNPELPTGCEVTSLAIVLNYLGYDIDKVTLSDSYLPKGEIGKTNPNEAFIGDPKSSHSYGAYAPVLVKTANDYLDSVSAEHVAYNVSTDDLHSLLKYINDGYPVIVWATMNLMKSYPSTKWIIDNQEVQWYANEHCMVLIGYTDAQYIFADPLNGIKYYDRAIFQKRYNELGNQAIVIY